MRVWDSGGVGHGRGGACKGWDIRVLTCLLLVMVSALSRAQVLMVKGEATVCSTTRLLGAGGVCLAPTGEPQGAVPCAVPVRVSEDLPPPLLTRLVCEGSSEGLSTGGRLRSVRTGRELDRADAR